MQIREFMTQPVVTVHEDTTLEEVARTMLEQHIGGVPVVNAQGKLSGIITVSDFTAKEHGIPFSTFRAPQVFGHWLGGEPLEQIYAMARQMTVRDIMSPHVITVTEEQAGEEAMTLFLRHDIHRIPVVRDGVPVGMISQYDLLRLMMPKPQRGVRL
jgi:CBS domain-containing protein